jgi:hypothetical protein
MPGHPKHISAIVDYRINFFAVEHVLKALAKQGCHVDVFCSGSLVEAVRAALPENQITIRNLDEIRRRMALWYRLHRVTRLIVANPNFSTASWYQHERERNSPKFGIRVLYKATERLPKLRNTSINRFLRSTVGLVIPNVFRTQTVVTPSRTLVPELLCARGLRIATIVESWDHPGKYPTGFVSNNAFVWNKTLGEDWLHYQGDKRYTVSFPIKHRYVVEHAQRQKPLDGARQHETRGSRTIMYPATWTSQSSNKAIFREELQQIEELCQAAKRHGVTIFIKPKPQGNTRDFDFLKDKYSNVIIGGYKQSGDRPEDYYLDSEYNRQRLAELGQCDSMINGGTTFGIDATIFGLPVLQLDFRESSRYPITAKAFHSYHLEKYFLRDPALTLPVKSNDSLLDVVDAYLMSPDYRDAKFSKRVKNWLYTDESFEDAMTRVATTILSE